MIANGMCLRANLLNIERILRRNCGNLEKTVENVHILTHFKLFIINSRLMLSFVLTICHDFNLPFDDTQKIVNGS